MNKIEKTIDEIEEYIENCRTQMLSNKILVDKDAIMELLSELRENIPDEIKRNQKMLANRDAIIEAAKKEAAACKRNAEAEAANIINQANIHREECVSEHEVMQQAYAQANDILAQTSNEAQKMVDEAAGYAENYRMSAIRYTDDLLAGMQNLIAATMESTKVQYEKFFASLSDSYDVISSNRNELYPDTKANLEYVSEEEDTEE